MTRFKTVPLTDDLFMDFYANDSDWSIDDGVMSVRNADVQADLAIIEGLALLEDDKVVAISGLMTDAENTYSMEDHTKTLDLKNFSVRRFIKRSVDLIRQYPSFTVANKEIEGSDNFLKKVGFIEVIKGVYKWPK